MRTTKQGMGTRVIGMGVANFQVVVKEASLRRPYLSRDTKELGSEPWQYLRKELKEEQAPKIRACLPHLRCSKIAGVAGAGWKQVKFQRRGQKVLGDNSERVSQETGRTLTIRMF